MVLGWEVWWLPITIAFILASDRLMAGQSSFIFSWACLFGAFFLPLANVYNLWATRGAWSIVDLGARSFVAFGADQVKAPTKAQTLKALTTATALSVLSLIAIGPFVKAAFEFDIKIPIFTAWASSTRKHIAQFGGEISHKLPLAYTDYGTVIGPRLVEGYQDYLKYGMAKVSSIGVDEPRWGDFRDQLLFGGVADMIKRWQETANMFKVTGADKFLQYYVFSPDRYLVGDPIRHFRLVNKLLHDHLKEIETQKVVQINITQYVETVGIEITRSRRIWLVRKNLRVPFTYLENWKEKPETYFSPGEYLSPEDFPSICLAASTKLQTIFGFEPWLAG
jgi:hypothetical protein